MGDDDLHSIAFSSSHSPYKLDAQIISSQLCLEKESGYPPSPQADVFSHGDYSSYAPNYNSSSSNCVGEEECDRFEYNLSSSFCDIVNNSGYLEDVLLEFSSKRRRLEFLFTDDDKQQHFRYISEKNCSSMDFMENFEGNIHNLDHIINPARISGVTTSDKITKKRATTAAKVVYPFAVVKPGGFEGDVTLNDINERILMPPMRPIRHPVGNFACKPMVVSPQGPGLSGKAVVAFTRLHTQGRGTITIIRTRG